MSRQITAEELSMSSARAQFLKRPSLLLTLKEATKHARTTERTTYIYSATDKVIFFTDDHLFGYPLLPKHYVSSSGGPVVPDEYASFEEFLATHYKDAKLIESIEELIKLLPVVTN